MGFLSLLRLRVLFPLFLKLSEPVSHTLSFGRSVLFLGRFLSVLNCLLPFCKVLVILCHNSLCFAVSFHKCLYIRITVIGQNIGEFIQFFIKFGFGLLYLFFQSLSFLTLENTRCSASCCRRFGSVTSCIFLITFACFCTFSIRVCIVRNSSISILRTGLGGISFSRMMACRNSFALPTIPRTTTASITTKRSKRKTVLTMKSTACREQRKCRTGTRKSPLSA